MSVLRRWLTAGVLASGLLWSLNGIEFATRGAGIR